MENISPELREKIVMQLLENKKYIYNPPFEIILTAAVICNYVQYGKLPVRSANGNDLILEEIVHDIAKKVYTDHINTVRTTNERTPSDDGLVIKFFRFLGF
ncbi:Uncharacterised protein [Chryseobacterium carnipullorum]|uniref:Uncharacterized protein n=1 Tax=Chryseobacterium carnipullorum TaxID=1124835 RepID=A0A376DVU6_CHRCU|nr:Uncharacterised protein [Chryseobacterium carnipullorum]